MPLDYRYIMKIFGNAYFGYSVSYSEPYTDGSSTEVILRFVSYMHAYKLVPGAAAFENVRFEYKTKRSISKTPVAAHMPRHTFRSLAPLIVLRSE